MVEETGEVVALDAGAVWVETVRQSACGSCSARHGCGQRVLAKLGEGKRFRVQALNPSQLVLRIGDQVRLGLAETAFVKASALVYLIPLLGLAGGALLGDLVAGSEGVTILVAALGLGLGLAGVYWHGRTSARSCDYQPVILKVLAPTTASIGDPQQIEIG